MRVVQQSGSTTPPPVVFVSLLAFASSSANLGRAFSSTEYEVITNYLNHRLLA